MKESRDIKNQIISHMLENYDYNLFKNTVIAWKGIGDLPKTKEEFKQIAKEYGISLYEIAKKYARTLDDEDNDKRINSIADTYVYSLYRNRKPPKKVVLFLLNQYKSLYGIRAIYRFEITRIILSALKQNGYDTEKGFDKDSVSDELLKFSIEELEVLKECIDSMIADEDLELEHSDNCPTIIELWEENITNLSDVALLFFYKNFDVLNKYMGELRVIIDGVFHFEDDDFRNLIDQLKTKKAHAKDSRIYKCLSECKFDQNVCLDLIDREEILDSLIEHTNEVSDYRDLDSFVSLCRKMCHDYQLVWKTILIILMHYGNKPSGKRVSDLFDNYYTKKAATVAAQIDQSLFNP